MYRELGGFVRSCRLGQTERGRLVATVECALDADEGGGVSLWGATRGALRSQGDHAVRAFGGARVHRLDEAREFTIVGA